MRLERCPNCGNRLTPLREERQRAGRREIVLRWLLCARCRHVALDDWRFADEVERDAVAARTSNGGA